MRTVIAGNWKMNTDRNGAVALAKAVADRVGESTVEVVLAPPFPYLADVVEAVRGSRVIVAAQNCHEAGAGAYTGEVSVGMLKDIGVRACIVGHSERRQYQGETDESVSRKVKALAEAGLMPIYCCGETLAERESGQHFATVGAQLRNALSALPPDVLARTVLAYEPVWAIGTGLTASDAQAQEMHAFIRKELAAFMGPAAAGMPLLYGGSCKPDNAAGIFAGADVDGGLIGGAALQAASFVELVRIAERSRA